MSIVKKEIDYAKEIGDVFLLVEEVIKVIKKKGDYMSLIDELVAAVDGVSGVEDELKANQKAAIQTASYHLGAVVDALIHKEVA